VPPAKQWNGFDSGWLAVGVAQPPSEEILSIANSDGCPSCFEGISPGLELGRPTSRNQELPGLHQRPGVSRAERSCATYNCINRWEVRADRRDPEGRFPAERWPFRSRKIPESLAKLGHRLLSVVVSQVLRCGQVLIAEPFQAMRLSAHSQRQCSVIPESNQLSTASRVEVLAAKVFLAKAAVWRRQVETLDAD